MPEHIEVTVGGITYNNVRQAWRAISPEGLPEITVRKRLKAGWLAIDAFCQLPVPPRRRRRFKEFRTGEFSDLCRTGLTDE